MNKIQVTLAIILFCFLPSAAVAMPSWTSVASEDLRNIDQLALARDESGVLHLFWRFSNTTIDEGYRYRSLQSDGATFSGTTDVQTDWDTLSNPDLRILNDGKVQAVFAGTNSTLTRTGGLYTLEGNSTGTTWDLIMNGLEDSHSSSAESIVSTTPGSATLFSAWASTGGLFYHQGENSLMANEFTADQPSCCASNANFGVDAVTGDIFIGWYSSATNEVGHFVQSVSPRADTATYVPVSAREDRVSALSINQRMPITGRIGAGGVYVAYCTGYPFCDAINLWRVGNTDPTTIYDESGGRNVNLFQGPDGRLWAVWTKGVKAYATRSNPDATEFGRIQTFDLPGDQTVYRLGGEGSLGPLDLFATAGLSGVEHYHMRVQPALTLTGRPKRVRPGTRVRFRVMDAGDPVQGAKVKAFGKRTTTRANGRAIIKVPSVVRKKKGKATKSGYAKSNTVKFKRR